MILFFDHNCIHDTFQKNLNPFNFYTFCQKCQKLKKKLFLFYVRLPEEPKDILQECVAPWKNQETKRANINDLDDFKTKEADGWLSHGCGLMLLLC